MSSPEKRIEKALRRGSIAAFSDNEKRAVSAEWLAEVLGGRAGPKDPHPRGLRVKNAHITGPAIWDHDSWKGFELIGCQFDGAISAVGLTVDGRACFERCRIEKLDLSQARISGALSLRDLRTAELGDPPNSSSPMINLEGTSIGRSLSCKGARLRNPGGDALYAYGATIGGDVLFTGGFKAHGEVSLLGAEIGGALDCEGAKFRNPAGDALSADGTTISSDVLFTNGFRSVGSVRLAGARIGGQLHCEGARLRSPEGDALSADGVTIGGDVLLTHGFTSIGAVRLAGAEIGGELSCRGAQLLNPDDVAFLADGVTIGGDVYFTAGFTAVGTVRLFGAQIGGQLNFTGAEIRSPDGDALLVDGSKIKGSVGLIDGFKAFGTTRFLGAQIGGQLACHGAELHCPDGISFTADHASIGGSVYLVDGFRAAGSVRFAGARIGGQLNCSGAELLNPEGSALVADGATISGDILLTDGFRSKGCVGLSQTSCGGGLSFSGASLESSTSKCIEADGLSVLGELDLRGLRQAPAGSVNLRGSRVGLLSDDPESWPSTPGRLTLTGFHYEHLGAAALAWTAEQRLAWIRNQTSSVGGYAVQPYVELASAYQDVGRDRDRSKVVIAKQNDLRRYGDLGAPSWIWNWLLKILTGHGERLWRTLVAILLVYGAAVGTVWVAKSHQGLLPVGSTAVLAQTSSSTGQQLSPATQGQSCTNRYPCVSEWLYPVDAAVPGLDLHQDGFWAFNAATTWGQATELLLSSLILLAWLLMALLIAGLAGLIRRG